jgi:hypothetical protein
VLRAPGVSFGLPYLFHPDEPGNVYIGVSMADTRTINPHSFAYPSFMYDIVAGARVVEHLFATVHAGAGIVQQNLGTGYTADPGLFLGLRIFVMLVSIALCLLTWYAVRWITESWWAATFAALLLAVSPLMVINGVYITPDTYSAFFCGAALVTAFAVLRDGRALYYLLAGAAVGLAAGSKYNAAAVGIAVVTAHVLRHHQASLRPREISSLGLAALMAGVAFLVVTPGAVLSPHEFYSQATAQLHIYQTGHPGIAGQSITFYTTTLRQDSPLWLAALAAAVACLFTKWRNETIILLIYTVCYLALIGSQVVHYGRDVLPAMPALAMLAGIGGASLFDVATRLGARRVPAIGGVNISIALAAVAGVAALAFPAAASAHQVSALSDPSRAKARTWLETHIRTGSTIVVESYGPWMPTAKYHLISPEFVVATKIPSTASALVVTESGTGRYLADPKAFPAEVSTYRRLRQTWCQAAYFDDGPWDLVLVPCHQQGHPPGAEVAPAGRLGP